MSVRRRAVAWTTCLLLLGGASLVRAQQAGGVSILGMPGETIEGPMDWDLPDLGGSEEPAQLAPSNPALTASMAASQLFADWVPAHLEPDVVPVEGRSGFFDVSFDIPGRRGDGLEMLADLAEAKRAEGGAGAFSSKETLRALRHASRLARTKFPDEPLNVHVRMDTGYRPEEGNDIGEVQITGWDVFLGKRPGKVTYERDHIGRMHTTPVLARTLTDGLWEELGIGRAGSGTVHPPVFLPDARGPGGARGAVKIRYTTYIQQGPESVTGDFTFGLWPHKPDPTRSVLRLGVGVQGKAKPKSARGLLKSMALEIASDTVRNEVPNTFQGIWRQLRSHDKLVLAREEPLRIYTRKAWHEDYRKPDPSRKYGRSRQHERKRQQRHQRNGPNIYTTEVVNSGRSQSGGNLYIDLKHTQEALLGKSEDRAGVLAPVIDDFWVRSGSVGFGFTWEPVDGEGAAE